MKKFEVLRKLISISAKFNFNIQEKPLIDNKFSLFQLDIFNEIVTIG